jgi:hypothetical protein
MLILQDYLLGVPQLQLPGPLFSPYRSGSLSAAAISAHAHTPAHEPGGSAGGPGAALLLGSQGRHASLAGPASPLSGGAHPLLGGLPATVTAAGEEVFDEMEEGGLTASQGLLGGELLGPGGGAGKGTGEFPESKG